SNETAGGSSREWGFTCAERDRRPSRRSFSSGDVDNSRIEADDVREIADAPVSRALPGGFRAGEFGPKNADEVGRSQPLDKIRSDRSLPARPGQDAGAARRTERTSTVIGSVAISGRLVSRAPHPLHTKEP